MMTQILHWFGAVARPISRRRPYLWGSSVLLMAFLLVGCGTSSPSSDGPAADGNASPMVAASPEAALAQHLTATGSAMYGAYWCPHCADQKAMFGEAVDQIPYVECAADGKNAQPDLCSTKGIQAYPTWEINGQLYPGVKSLDDLAQLSGYQAAL